MPGAAVCTVFMAFLFQPCTAGERVVFFVLSCGGYLSLSWVFIFIVFIIDVYVLAL